VLWSVQFQHTHISHILDHKTPCFYILKFLTSRCVLNLMASKNRCQDIMLYCRVKNQERYSCLQQYSHDSTQRQCCIKFRMEAIIYERVYLLIKMLCHNVNTVEDVMLFLSTLWKHIQRVEVQFHLFLTSPLDSGEGLTSRFIHLISLRLSSRCVRYNEGNKLPSTQLLSTLSLIWQHVSTSEGDFQASSIKYLREILYNVRNKI
jgi:hypothetical protein